VWEIVVYGITAVQMPFIGFDPGPDLQQDFGECDIGAPVRGAVVTDAYDAVLRFQQVHWIRCSQIDQGVPKAVSKNGTDDLDDRDRVWQVSGYVETDDVFIACIGAQDPLDDGMTGDDAVLQEEGREVTRQDIHFEMQSR